MATARTTSLPKGKRYFLIINLVYAVNMLLWGTCGAAFDIHDTTPYALWGLSHYLLFVLTAIGVESAIGHPIDTVNDRLLTKIILLFGLYTPSIISGFFVAAWRLNSAFFWGNIALFLVLTALPFALTWRLSSRVAGDLSIIKPAALAEFDALDATDPAIGQKLSRPQSYLTCIWALIIAALVLLFIPEWLPVVRYIGGGVLAVVTGCLYVIAMRALYRNGLTRRILYGCLRIGAIFAVCIVLSMFDAPRIFAIWTLVLLDMPNWVTRRRIMTVLGEMTAQKDEDDEDSEYPALDPDDDIYEETSDETPDITSPDTETEV